VTLSPLSPSPYQGEGEEIDEGLAPLLDTPTLLTWSKESRSKENGVIDKKQFRI